MHFESAFSDGPNYIWETDHANLRMLTCDYSVPPDRYNERIGVVQCQKALVNALIERWHPDTHTFHLLIGECAVTLEDVAIILGLPTDGLLVTGMTMSSFEALEAECLHQFGVAPSKSACRGVHCKYLPLLCNFGSIGQYSWRLACLVHLYKALCKASRYDCKEIDGLLTFLFGWAWIRLPYLAPLPRESRSFPLANRWRNWERRDRRYRYLTLAHFRKALDDLQEGHVCFQGTLDTYKDWYRAKFGDRLNLSSLVV
ncbi:protein MAIN-LIKE 1-like [Arachis ipaensis]|uniref:protein MAIN-LIKE 1-like n=1 Tax=Arachis ipaensis TaxID=130454 RepID=UPI000A2B8C8B|nr:protein MAIN-LIKE 1-like [Arachis ipaensis]XP_025678146.1 protein MAIN-LIKE 1 [Arachis hypogaea]